MISIINLKGYSAKDPLDKAPGFMEYGILIIVNFILTVILLYLITTFEVVKFNGFTIFNLYFPPFWSMVLETILNSLVFSIIISYMRKSSSVVLYLVVFIPYYLMDLYLESNVRNIPGKALWEYYNNSLISFVQPPALKFFITISVDAILFGIIGIYISRLLASIIYRRKEYPQGPSIEEYNKLFSQEWSNENVDKPKRDAGYWILRLLGLGYLIYLLVLLIGILGIKPWPSGIANLIDMTYKNPALAINTYFKIGLMTFLTFLGAYNINLRFHCAIGLIVGHSVSTIYSLMLYFLDPANDYSSFLITSAIVDGVMIIIFLWILFKYKKDSGEFKPENEFPLFFSIPATINGYLYGVLGVIFFLVSILIIVLRLFTSGSTGISAVYGYPDPMIGNTLTLYVTLGLISILLIKRDKLRNHFFNLIFFPLAFGTIVSLLWVIVGNLASSILINVRQYTIVSGLREHFTTTADWYFVLYALINFTLASLMLIFRKMYYNVDYAINTLNPSTARNIIALANAFFPGDEKQQSEILQSIDQFTGGIRGRKRGLLNLPFALLENTFNWILGLHPPFSSMSRDEQRYFLRKYIYKNEAERKTTFIPLLSDIVYQIGLSLNAMILFAHYSYINVRYKIGYIPLDARDRTQGDFAAYDPPFKNVAKLPVDENDAANFKPLNNENLSQVAPRVTTPVKEQEVPTEVDYLIVGSGAGGATAAYRLACSVNDPENILIVERGNRYQPLQDFNDSEIDMMKKIYKEGGLQQTKKFTFSILQGECVGGTTVSNNAACLKMPDKVKSLWEKEYQIDLGNLDDEYKTIEKELHITPLGEKGINKLVKEKFIQAVTSYNSQVPEEEQLQTEYPLLINHLNNIGDGNWNLGNKRMRKRSMLETYIPWSEARGVRVVSNLTAVRFVEANNKKNAEYVILRADNGSLSRVKIRKAVIVAGGVIASSHFLMRSNVKNENIGKRLSCNFAMPLSFEFDEDIKAFDGEQITLAAADPKSRAIFETYFNPPASFALSGIPFVFDRRDSIMDKYKNLLNFGTLIGSEPNGVLYRKADLLNGQAFDWELGRQDIKNIKYAISTLVRLGKLAGSKRVVIPTKPGIELRLDNNDAELFIKTFNDFPLRITDLSINTAHPQGGNLTAGSNSKYSGIRVINEDFKLDKYNNVFVADASLFPTSLTVNPQWTIMAMSSMAAKSVLKYFP